MRRLPILLVAALAALLAGAAPAQAGPVALALAPMITALSGAWAAVGTGLLGTALKQLAVSLVLSRIGRATQKPPVAAGAKLKVDLGGDKNQPVILGRYATAGHLVWAGSSDGNSESTPNAFYTEVILLSVLPGLTLRRVAVNGAWCALKAAHPNYAEYGEAVEGFAHDDRDKLWIKFYGSGATVPDPMLRANHGDDADWPWEADMIGRGVAFAIVTSRFSDEVHRGRTAGVLFELDGIPLYDRRRDGTAGGTGTQRRADRATWAQSDNAIVAIDTLLGPGLGYGAEHLYGPRFPAHVLPVARVLAAANACDALVPLAGGGTEKAYRFGCELDLATEPKEVIRELLKSCAGDIATCEGRILLHVGAAGAPVRTFTDRDCSIEDPQELEPFRGVERTYNGATATFPDPEESWATAPAPPRYNAAWEAEDGGRRQLAPLAYPYVPHVTQVQRLMTSALLDERRQRTHQVVLPPRFGDLEPLDYVAWNSTRNGYIAKLFKITEATDLAGGFIALSLLEEDPDDYDWVAGFELPHTPVPIPLPILSPYALPGFAVEPWILTDETGGARRPALRLTWTASELDPGQGVAWERRVVGQAAVVPGSLSEARGGQAIVSEGIIPGQAYEVRGWLLARGIPITKSAWIPVVAPGLRLGTDDIDGSFRPGNDGVPPPQVTGLGITPGIRLLWLAWSASPVTDLDFYEIYEAAAATPAPVLATAATFRSAQNFSPRLVAGDQVTRHYWVRAVDTTGNRGAWSVRAQGTTAERAGITNAILAGLIDATSYAAGMAGVEILGALPAAGNFAGRQVFLTTDQKVYRHTGAPLTAAGFTKAADGADLVANSITGGKIQAAAIATEQLAANAVTAAKMLLIDRENLCPEFNFEEGDADLFVTDGNGAIGFSTAARTASRAAVLSRVSTTPGTVLLGRVGSLTAVKAGEDYWLEAEFCAHVAGGPHVDAVEFRVRWYDGTKVALGTAATSIGIFDVTTAWQTKTGKLVAPAGARWATLDVFIRAGGTLGSLRIDRMVLRRANAAELVVDGSIRANMLSVEELLTNSAQIGDGIITRAKIALAAIGSAQIENASIGTLEVAGQAITAVNRSIDFRQMDVTVSNAWTYTAYLGINRVPGFSTDLIFSSALDAYGPGVLVMTLWRKVGNDIFRYTGLEARQSTGKSGRQVQVTWHTVDQDQRGGRTVYALAVRRHVDGDDEFNNPLRVWGRYLSAQQFKR